MRGISLRACHGTQGDPRWPQILENKHKSRYFGSSPLAAFLEATLKVYHRDMSDFGWRNVKNSQEVLWCWCGRVPGAGGGVVR